MLTITLRGLEVFVAVAEAGSFGAAAASLNISQPSVSVHMRTLEAKVGSPLFERHPGVAPQLTDAGRTLRKRPFNAPTPCRLSLDRVAAS
jgi:DNA-binding transcriptional LysR family regulator